MDKEVLQLAIASHGKYMQLDVCVEEMAELTKEICKFKRGKNNRVAIIEEIADVLIMIEQLKIMQHIKESEIEEVIDYKIQRLKGRLEKHD